MKRLDRMRGLVLLFVGITLMAGTSLAQRGGGGDWMARMGQRMVPVEAVLTFLAFDDKVNLDDDGLLKVREALRPIVKKRGELNASDRDAMMAQVEGLREEMRVAVTAVLTETQSNALGDFVMELNERAQQARNWGGGGGGRSRGN